MTPAQRKVYERMQTGRCLVWMGNRWEWSDTPEVVNQRTVRAMEEMGLIRMDSGYMVLAEKMKG